MSASVFCLQSAILAVLTASPANAQEPVTAATPPGTADWAVLQPGDGITPPPQADAIHLSMAPYMWLTGISGEITLRNITVDADVTFSDIFDAADSVLGFMGAIDIEYKGFVAQFNAAWSQVEISGARALARNGTLTSDLTMDTAWIEAFGGYRFLERPLEPDSASRRRFTLDGILGARFTMIDVDASFKAETDLTLPDGQTLTAGQTADRDRTETWFEMFVGARMGIDLTERWSLSVRGDVGGFGVSGADFAWQVAALVGYRWDLDGWSIGVFGGYRSLGQDYSSGDFAWDAVTHGPLLGAHFGWEF